ncbi:BglG family transcription antiterminator [Caldibacillus debilis]|uniref:BglG family transcription antiterminator n=1 Tax=Caldibacillus debilis TaxID=301148 RepID=UPI0023F4CFA1|nr:BglG family transcription antiterminator [Caldibacillus debilis]
MEIGTGSIRHSSQKGGERHLYLDKRSSAVLLFLANRNDYVSIRELERTFRISRRTIYYDLGKINAWLRKNDLQPIQYIRSHGYFLTDEARKAVPQKLAHLKQWEYEYTPDERIGWLAFYLFIEEHPLFLDDLSKKTRVSRNTTIDDLKKLKKELQTFSLSLRFHRQKGYFIHGDENEKRKAIVYFTSKIIPPGQEWQAFIANVRDLFQKNVRAKDGFLKELEEIISILNEYEREIGIQFADEALHHLALRLWLFGKRVVKGNQVTMDPVEKEIIRQTKEFQFAKKNIIGKISSIFPASFSDDEICYVTTHLLSAKIQQTNRDGDNADIRPLKVVARKMVTDFQSAACVTFSDRNEVEKNLLIHLKPAYYRIKYGIKAENPLAEQIKSEYKEIFLITKKVIHHFETLVGKKVEDDETALIALHFGGWLQKEGLKPPKRKKALIVCPSGIGTSTILKHQLEGLFSTVDFVETLSVRDFEKRSLEDIDFTISTVPIRREGHIIIPVHPILTDVDKERLLKKVHSLSEDAGKMTKYSAEAIVEIVKQHAAIEDEERLLAAIREYLYRPEVSAGKGKKPGLMDLLQLPLIQVRETCSDWKQAVETASLPLLQNGYIDSGYIRAMIRYIETYGPYPIISPKVALPHGKPEDGVQKTGISLLVLKRPVSFSREERHRVQLIFVLASVDQETHLFALSQLSEVLSDPQTVEKLTESNAPEGVWELLRERIHETSHETSMEKGISYS